MTHHRTSAFSLPVRAAALALRRFGEKNGLVMSSHVAMSLMLALFPFILFVVALAGTLSQDLVTDDLIELVFGAWPDMVAEPIVAEVKAVLAGANTGVVTFGGLLALYFASNGVDAIRQAMSRAYHDVDDRPFWKARLLSVGLVIAGSAAMLAAMTFEVVLPVYANLVSEALPGQPPRWISPDRLQWIFVVALPAVGVLACHALLPARRHTLRQILPGVAVTLILWGALGWGFSIYIANFATYSATYAGLAGAMAALIFLYLDAAILILGAEFNGALIELGSSRPMP